MEQHAIPQQISSYEFKLVGEMTLKQFLKAAAGIILAIIMNATKLMVIIKWPLMMFFAGGGLLLAFVPFEDRPLETWIIAFIKSIYSPTIYTYKKKADKNWLDLDLTQVSVSKMVSVKKTKSGEGKEREQIKLTDFFQTTSITKTTDTKENEPMEVKVNVEDDINQVKEVEEMKVEEAVMEQRTKTDDWREEKANLGLKSEKLEATGKVIFGSIPMPDIPEVANVVVGMATSGEGKIVDGVIVEIQDEHGNPSRVLKTNSLGQFKTSTPLANGRYLVIAEKESYIFDRVNLDLTGQIVQPIKIIAHN